MLVTLQCNSCRLEITLPILVGGPYPQIDSTCNKCDNGYMLIKNITPENGVELLRSAEESSPKPNLKPNTSPGGRNILSSFNNRLSPIVVVVQLMHEIAIDGVITLSDLINRFNERSCELRQALKDLEAKVGVKRGERLSDGFHGNTSLDEGPMKIAYRNILGTDGERILLDRGAIQKMGLAYPSAQHSNKFILTEAASDFNELTDLRRELLNLSEPEIISQYPILPRYISKKSSREIIDLIFKLLPDEKAWFIHVLEIISEATAVNPGLGWDSNHYAAEEAGNCAEGNCHPRWSNDSGDTLFEKYKKRAVKQRKRKPEYYATDRLENFINSSLGGLLGRMKELGVISPVRIGSTKNFLITEFGEEILRQHLASNLSEVEA